jgi:hypothetical protein
MRDDSTSGGAARMRGSSAQESQTLPRGNAALQKEGTDLIDDAGALVDQSLAYPV